MFLVQRPRTGLRNETQKHFSAPPVVCLHLVYFFGEASMSVNHPASPGAARRVDYFDFGVDGGAMSALPRKRTCAVQLGMSALCR